MLCYWRFKGRGGEWRFGFLTDVGHGLVRMGWWNGDVTHGSIVDRSEIEIRS